jgi:hypothetical protein
MKRSTAFLLILVSSLSFRSLACGPYYPLGDDIRFTLLDPGTFNYSEYSEFYYSSGFFYSSNFESDAAQLRSPVDQGVGQNVALWRNRCKNKPDGQSVYQAVYLLGDEINRAESPNAFVRYLHENHDAEALAYLNFAKKCNPFNSVIQDPWERQEYANVPQRKKLIDEASNRAKSTKDEDIRRRYAFLAIRLAAYNDDNETLRSIYATYFNQRDTKNIVDYWSLYFRTLTETDSVKSNFDAAQVFAFAPDKRKAIFYRYNKHIPVEKTLRFAKTSEEKQAVWMLDGFRKTGKTLDNLKKLYALKTNDSGLSFLLLREINKLEDWIYTPYYTNFNPSLEPWEYGMKDYPAQRIEEDRKYAKDLLGFVKAADLRKIENPQLWRLAKAYLSYMTGDYSSSLNEINALQKQSVSDLKLRKQLSVLKAICLTTSQKDKHIVPDEIKPVLMDGFASGNFKLIFAVARELEFKGNTTDAAALLSKFKLRPVDYGDQAYWRNGIYWKTKPGKQTLFVEYYDDYFFYLDAQYSAEQLKRLIADLDISGKKDSFSKWEFDVLRKDKDRLNDLLGTKYMRKNELNQALLSFEKVADTLWTSKYYPYATYLNANPFYATMYSEHRKTAGDTISYTKAGIARTLINYLAKAENTQTKNRAYYYFQVANCYLNMTQYGNSWMMKRYYWTVNRQTSGFEDNDDYYNCTLASQYYLKAKELSASKLFAALCLRMAGRCESHHIRSQMDPYGNDQPKVENVYYNDLKKSYPAYYNDLISNCESFDRYYRLGKLAAK